MNKFWPPRPAAEGFSIEKLARHYRDKISKDSADKKEQIYIPENFIKDQEKQLNFKSNKQSIHWANRDFIEYKEAA